jgi:hypothetical protein
LLCWTCELGLSVESRHECRDRLSRAPSAPGFEDCAAVAVEHPFRCLPRTGERVARLVCSTIRRKLGPSGSARGDRLSGVREPTAQRPEERASGRSP